MPVVIAHSKEEIVAVARESADQLQKQLPPGMHCVVMIIDSATNEWAYRSFWNPQVLVGVARAIWKAATKKKGAIS